MTPEPTDRCLLLGLRERPLWNLNEPDFGIPKSLVVHVPQILRQGVVEEELAHVARIGLHDLIEIEADREQFPAHVLHLGFAGSANEYVALGRAQLFAIDDLT